MRTGQGHVTERYGDVLVGCEKWRTGCAMNALRFLKNLGFEYVFPALKESKKKVKRQPVPNAICFSVLRFVLPCFTTNYHHIMSSKMSIIQKSEFPNHRSSYCIARYCGVLVQDNVFANLGARVPGV